MDNNKKDKEEFEDITVEVEENTDNSEDIEMDGNNKKKPKKKRKKLKIFLIILLIFSTLIAGLVVWQWSNIVALYYSLRYSEEELMRMEEENKRRLNETIEQMNIEAPRELTKEEIKALESGVITQEEAIEISLGITTLEEKTGSAGEGSEISPSDGGVNGIADASGGEKSEAPVENTQNSNQQNATIPSGNKNGTSNETVEKKEASRLSELVAELYVLKSTYISKLDGLKAKAKTEYMNTPAEQRTNSWKTSAYARYAGEASAWEADCDEKVEIIISKIKAELINTGGDTSIINKIRDTYNSEKQIKKAQYLKKYM